MRLKFECQRCGSCCQGDSTISLTPQDIQRISNFLGISKQEFLENFAVIKSGNRVELKTVKGFCIFFDRESKTCKIHPVKPEKCREWPLVKAIFEDPETFRLLKSFCPGLKKISWEELQLFKNLKERESVLK
jgi:Fe-S-cluster containining protein